MRSRKGDAFIADYNKPLIYDPPRQLDLFGSAAAYFGLEAAAGRAEHRQPEEPAVGRGRRCATPTPPRRWAASIMKRASPGARSSPTSTRREGDVFPKLYGGVDFGMPLAVAQQLGLALRPRRASAGGQRCSPLAAYYFGSFRNNYVDDRPEKRYREMESFPGFDDRRDRRPPLRQADRRDQPAAAPLRRGRHAGLLPELHPAGRLRRGHGDRRRRTAATTAIMIVGAQLDLNFTVALRLPMVLLGRRRRRLATTAITARPSGSPR